MTPAASTWTCSGFRWKPQHSFLAILVHFLCLWLPNGILFTSAKVTFLFFYVSGKARVQKINDYYEVSPHWNTKHEEVLFGVLAQYILTDLLRYVFSLSLSIPAFISSLITTWFVFSLSLVSAVSSSLAAVALAPVLAEASQCWCAPLLSTRCLTLWWAASSSPTSLLLPFHSCFVLVLLSLHP